MLWAQKLLRRGLGTAGITGLGLLVASGGEKLLLSRITFPFPHSQYWPPCLLGWLQHHGHAAPSIVRAETPASSRSLLHVSIVTVSAHASVQETRRMQRPSCLLCRAWLALSASWLPPRCRITPLTAAIRRCLTAALLPAARSLLSHTRTTPPVRRLPSWLLCLHWGCDAHESAKRRMSQRHISEGSLNACIVSRYWGIRLLQ